VTDQTTASRAREIRDQLDRIVPAPSAETSALDVARYLGAQALASEARFAVSLKGAVPDITACLLGAASFAAAHALRALHAEAPDVAAGVASQIAVAWDMGESGELAWDFLGDDAAEVGALAEELAAVAAPLSPAAINAAKDAIRAKYGALGSDGEVEADVRLVLEAAASAAAIVPPRKVTGVAHSVAGE
jgi:hypothetical protein